MIGAVGGDEVGDLRRVHARAAADADEAVEASPRPRNRRPPATSRRSARRGRRPRHGLDALGLDPLAHLSVIPAAITPGSDTTMTRLAPSRLSSQPVSAEAPGPNLIGVASMVKIVSWRGAPSPAVVMALLSRLRLRYPGAPGRETSALDEVRRRCPGPSEKNRLVTVFLRVKNSTASGPWACRSPEERVLPAREREERHRRGDADVHADHADLDVVAEAPDRRARTR